MLVLRRISSFIIKRSIIIIRFKIERLCILTSTYRNFDNHLYLMGIILVLHAVSIVVHALHARNLVYEQLIL